MTDEHDEHDRSDDEGFESDADRPSEEDSDHSSDEGATDNGSLVSDDADNADADDDEDIDDTDDDRDDDAGATGRSERSSLGRRLGGDRATPGPSTDRPISLPVAVLGVVAIVAVAVGAFLFLRGDDGLGEGVALSVNGEDVTIDTFNRHLVATEELYGIEVPQPGTEEYDRYRRDFARTEALRLVFQQEAADRGVVIAERQVQDALARLIEQRYPVGGRDAFITQLGDAGVSEQEVLDELRRGLINRQLFNEIVPTPEITDDEVRGEYDALGDRLVLGETRTVRHIVVATDAEAQEVLNRLSAGESFADVAADVSLDGSTAEDGGLIGNVEADLLDPAFSTATFAAAVGQAFGPVQTELGWHVGLVESVTPPGMVPFDQVLEPLRANIQFRCQQTVWRDFIADALERADVEYADDYRPENPNEPPPLTLAPETTVADGEQPTETTEPLSDEVSDPSICGSNG